MTDWCAGMCPFAGMFSLGTFLFRNLREGRKQSLDKGYQEGAAVSLRFCKASLYFPWCFQVFVPARYVSLIGILAIVLVDEWASGGVYLVL